MEQVLQKQRTWDGDFLWLQKLGFYERLLSMQDSVVFKICFGAAGFVVNFQFS